METSTSDFQSLAARIEKLERQNALFKRGGLALLVCTAALVLMGQARPSKTVTAQRILLVDQQGATRAELGIVGKSSHLWLYSAGQNDPEVLITTAAESRGDLGAGVLLSTGTSTRALLQATKDGAVLNLFGADKSWTHLGVGSFDLRLPTNPADRSGQWLTVFSDVLGPNLKVNDEEGFSAVVGVAGLQVPESGVHQRTSSASVHLFKKDGKVLWSAPPE